MWEIRSEIVQIYYFYSLRAINSALKASTQQATGCLFPEARKNSSPGEDSKAINVLLDGFCPLVTTGRRNMPQNCKHLTHNIRHWSLFLIISFVKPGSWVTKLCHLVINFRSPIFLKNIKILDRNIWRNESNHAWKRQQAPVHALMCQDPVPLTYDQVHLIL